MSLDRGSAAGPLGRGPIARLTDLCAIAVAVAGAWLLWSSYASLAGLSWWYESTERLRATTIHEKPDFDLHALPWHVAAAHEFEFGDEGLTLVTGTEPFTYQAYATISSSGAASADLHFDAFVESGAVSIGLLQSGKWIATSSSAGPGAFTDSNAARLGYRRMLTVVIANNNPGGESRLTVKSLRLFLRR
jgi:hypothetical protein